MRADRSCCIHTNRAESTIMTTKKFYQIGHVCKLTELPHSTIRFWEKSFPTLKPMRSSGGHRYYTSEQVELLEHLKQLLHKEGYTIDGAKKRLAMEKKQAFPSYEEAENDVREPEKEDLMQEMKTGLEEILLILKNK